MEKIDEKLNHWIHNSKVRAEIREIIEYAIIDAKGEGFKAGYAKRASAEGFKLEEDIVYNTNTNKVR